MLRYRLYLTAIVGAVPLAHATGVGAELRQPLGIAVSTVSWWAISLSLDRFRPRTRLRERRTISPQQMPAAARKAVGVLER